MEKVRKAREKASKLGARPAQLQRRARAKAKARAKARVLEKAKARKAKVVAARRQGNTLTSKCSRTHTNTSYADDEGSFSG